MKSNKLSIFLTINIFYHSNLSLPLNFKQMTSSQVIKIQEATEHHIPYLLSFLAQTSCVFFCCCLSPLYVLDLICSHLLKTYPTICTFAMFSIFTEILRSPRFRYSWSPGRGMLSGYLRVWHILYKEFPSFYINLPIYLFIQICLLNLLTFVKRTSFKTSALVPPTQRKVALNSLGFDPKVSFNFANMLWI